jgi:uncharacterized caspase-like protein
LAGALFFPAQGAADQSKYMFERPAERVALIVGNAEYKNVPAGELPGAVADATQMSDVLTSLHFDVIPALNVGTRADFINLYFKPFLNKIREGSLAIFYFSGHGFSYEGESYLTPLRFPGKVKSSDVFETFLSVTALRDMMNDRHPGALLMLLDACRDISQLVERDDGSATDFVAKGSLPRRRRRRTFSLASHPTLGPRQAAIQRRFLASLQQR